MGTKKIIVAIMGLIIIGLTVNVYALKPPHSATGGITRCAQCHDNTLTGFKSITSINVMCINAKGCHKMNSTAKKKSMIPDDMSNRFNSQPSTGAKQSAHGWKVPNIKKEAGVTVSNTWGETNAFRALSNKITCTRCHRAHGDKAGYTIHEKFLRRSPKGDEICIQCHAARQWDNMNVRDPLPASKHYSHPIGMNYSTAIQNSKGVNADKWFEASPTNPYPTNPSAELRLYTTYNFDSYGNKLSVKTAKAVVCSTCHGPIHSADSNPYTFDNISIYSRMGIYSSSAGNLLRRYPPTKKSNDICTSCHKVNTHQSFYCGRCHAPHKKEGENNRYLILENISTPSNGIRPVYFVSTTAMARRYGSQFTGGTVIYYGGYSTPNSRLDKANRKVSAAICQVCHTATKYHRNYSSATSPRAGHSPSFVSGIRFNNCVQCHPHNAAGGGFAQEGGCGTCHNAPPADTYGKHGKHTNTAADHDWDTGAIADARSQSNYGFGCGRCHNPYTPYTARDANPKNHYGTAPSVLKVYTADVGFGKGGHSLPTNTVSAIYAYGSGGTLDDGVSSSDKYMWRTPNNTGQGTCSNLYCHGQFYNGYTSNNPIWNGSTGAAIQGCGACHGASRTNVPGKTGGNSYGAHQRHVGNANNQQYGSGTPNFRCNACHKLTALMSNETTHDLDRTYHVNGRTDIKFDQTAIDGYGFGNTASRYGGINYTQDYYTSGKPVMFTRPAYKTCALIYCHSDGSRLQGNYSAPYDLGNTGSSRYPNWSSTRSSNGFGNFTMYDSTTKVKRRCGRCHGSSYKGITAAMPGYATRAGKGNSHKKHVVDNGFMCNVCHSATVGVVTNNKSIADTTKHVNKFYNVTIISPYNGGGATFNADKRCSNIKCHGGKLTAVWGDSGRCQDCHFRNTAESASDKGFKDNYQWRNMTSPASVPRIYSSEWTKSGHGRDSGTTYPSSGTSGANRVCTDCHKASASVSHQGAVSGNTFRVFTAPAHLDDLCLECHGTGYSKSGQATKKVLGHSAASMAGWGDASWQFTPKCIDCHDPHGDKNRYMIKAYVNYSGSGTGAGYSATDGRRWYDQNPSAQMTYSTVGGGQMNWSSYVKPDYSGICQRCHNLQNNMKNFNKAYKLDGGYKADHNARNRCTNCHKHDSGFKGMNCNGCHYFPPTLSGKHAFHVATTVDSSHVAYDLGSTKTKYAFGCGKCHNVPGSHYVDYGAMKVYTADLSFDATNTLPRNTGAQYAFGVKSSVDDGAGGADNFKWVSTKGTCKNLYCHGQFFGGYSGNDPSWYNNVLISPDDPQICGKCHGAVKNSSGSPTGGAHNKHVTGLGFKCRYCHRDTTGGFDAYTVADRKLHVNGMTNLWLYTTESRIGGAVRYRNAGSEFSTITTNANPASAPDYGRCSNLYCHSKGSDLTNPYNDPAAFPAYTAKWGDVRGGYKTGAKCKYCHGSKTGFTGITAAMPNYGNGSPKANRHSKHVATYGFGCKSCHVNVTVNNTSIDAAGGSSLHVNKAYNVKFDKSTRFINNSSGVYTYNATATGGRCTNSYCHSMGADRQSPYNDTATSYMNFTAKWGDNLGTYKAAKNTIGKCNYCHGNRSFAQTTGAMPYYNSGSPKANSHYKHVVSNGLGCNICHYGVARNNTSISDTTRHMNGFYNISIAPGYGLNGANQKRYSGVPANNTNGGTCKNITCHGSSGTPRWGSSLGCRNCHMTTNAGVKEDNFANWSAFKGTAAQIYSSDWGQKGHGKQGRDCTNCHNQAVAHGDKDRNPFRLFTSDTNALCFNCHGNSPYLKKWDTAMGNVTAIKTHSLANTGNGTFASWNNFQNQVVKCVDCHDPHGDKNRMMIHAQINYTGSDRFGRPAVSPSWNTVTPGAVTQMTYTSWDVQLDWSSFANTDPQKSICRRCHTPTTQDSGMAVGMTKTEYNGTHMPHEKCSNCHTHKTGFKPSGCTCHGSPPPPAPTGWSETNALHTPHASNPKNRPTIPASSGYQCKECHGNTSNGQALSGHSTYTTAVMQQLTSKWGDWSNGGTSGKTSVTDDTCSNLKCHTPRAYTRKWIKPTDCDDCHGYTKGRGTTGTSGRQFNLQTTQSHKIHINWTGTTNLPASWKKNYNFACKNCHYDWQTNNNYSTHYSGYVNMTSGGPVNKVGQDFYKRGKSFKGFTTGGELSPTSSTCSSTYCHGKFTNGTTATTPNWKKAVTTVTCTSCHRGKLTGSTMTNGDGYGMPERHPKHVSNSQGYGFACVRCHVRTTGNITTVYFTYSSHVNGRKDTYFDSQGSLNNANGSFNSASTSRKCFNIYCHSKGVKTTGSFANRSALQNFTADWDIANNFGYKTAKGNRARCNFCHGNRSFAGTTSAMPNYSTYIKANSHRKHVVDSGYTCKVCHYGVAMNNTSISDRTRHVNGFYNISLMPGFRAAAGKTYSMVYNGTGGTCKNNSCHGAAGTPKWGGTVRCFDCHAGTEQAAKPIKTAANGPNPVNFQQYTQVGHGKKNNNYAVSNNLPAGRWNSADSKGCYSSDSPSGCHSSAAAHTTKDTADPFRLGANATTINNLCATCHAAGQAQNHESAVTQGGTTFPFTPKCVDCHDPHGDSNIYMIRGYINGPAGASRGGSGVFGNPSTTQSQLSSVNFNNRAGKALNSYAQDDTNKGKGVCETCHSSSASPSVAWYNQEGASNAGAHSGNTGQCTAACHKHDGGFKGGGESSGNESCKDCHSEIFNPMNSQAKSYHHVMQNTTATGANKYPMSNSILATDARRRCLMCHADHNVFRPDMNGNDPRGRAANLRANIFTKATSNVASSRNNSDWSGTDSYGGICLSCHTYAQAKNTTKQFNDGSTKTLRLFTSLYRNTPHNYTAIGVIAKDGSKFKANCLKCHNDTMTKTKFKTNSGFGLHDSKLRRINSQLGLQIYDGTASGGSTTTLVQTGAGWTAEQWKQRVVTITSGTGIGQTKVVFNNTVDTLTIVGSWTAPASGSTFTIGDPPEEDYCYNCHSQSSNPNGSDAAGNKDYYGMVTFVNKKALKMEQTFTGDSGTATSGTTTTITDTSKAWITSPSQQWAGYNVKIIGGVNAGQERAIASHTGDTITISGAAFKKAIDLTSKYAIGNPFRHRIDQFSGQHKSDEAISSPGTATATGWFTDTGTGTHVGCADCHNPHSQRKPGAAQGKSHNNNVYTTITTIYDDGTIGGTKSWTAAQWRGYVMVAVDRSQAGEERMILSNTSNTFRVAAPFSARMTGVYYTILPKGRAYVATSTSRPNDFGNVLNGPNNGQWGVKVTKWDNPAPNKTTAEFNNMSAPTFAKMTTIYSMKNKTYELCLKCHSKYGWGTSGTPFRAMDTGLSTMGVYTGGRTTDISMEVNPKNLAHHALIEPGKNQPILANINDGAKTSSYNPNWPYYSSATAADTITITSGTATFANLAALPNTAIPGWYVWIGTGCANSDIPNCNVATAVPGTATKGWYQITEITSPTSFKVTPTNVNQTATQYWAISAGLGNNFVPPFGPWSVINCADCHDTDASGDPSGPHGSGRNWLLRKMESQTFKWMNNVGGAPTYLTVQYSNQGWASIYAANILCLNCHRADVYGADGNDPRQGALPTTSDGGYQNFSWRADLSRQAHTPESTVNAYGVPNGGTDGGDGNTFRMVCMHCHGGDVMGSIHGTNKGASLDNAGAVVASGRAYRGKRFLVGGSWNGLIRSTTSAVGTCYTNGRSTDDTINVCNRSEGKAMATFATYDYEAATDY